MMKTLTHEGFTYTRDEFIEHLESNLIPDLHESGRHATAADFELAVRFMKEEDKQRVETFPLGIGTYEEHRCPECASYLGNTPIDGHPNIINCANCKTRYRRPSTREIGFIVCDEATTFNPTIIKEIEKRNN